MSDCGRVYPLFFQPGEVVEIRAFGLRGKNQIWDGYAGGKGVVMGYFDDPARFAACAAALDALPHNGVYYTLNPVCPDLIARAANRLVAADDKRPSTADKDTALIRWLPFDFDPRRPSGISATEEELQQAIACASAAAAFLEGDFGFPRGLRALSGNGVHLVYRLQDLLPGETVSGAEGLVARALRAVAAILEPEHPGVSVDQKVFNAARIWKLYGAWSRKGDSTALRPHRKSKLYDGQARELAEVGVVPLAQLEGLAALAPAPAATAATAPGVTVARAGQRLGPLDLDRYFAEYGREIMRVKEDAAGRRYILRECVFDASHRGGEASVHQAASGLLTYQCYHDSCKGRTWHDAKRVMSGTDKLDRLCAGHDPTAKRKPRPVAGGAAAPPALPPPPSEDWVARLLTDAALLERGIEVVAGNTAIVPHPHDVSPMAFFEQVPTKNGVREHFSLRLMMLYLQHYLMPVRYVSGVYWRYSAGVWRLFADEEVGKVVVRALKERLRREYVEQGIKIYGYHLAMDEKLWAAPEWMINVDNGMLKLSGEGVERVDHAPEYWSRSQLPVIWDETAECPEWEKALSEIFNEPGGVGEEKILLLQEFFGYCLLPTCRYEKALFLYGTGANGKTTVLNVLDWVVGPENMSAISMEGLGRDFNLPYLIGKLVNIATEVESRESVGTENFKRLVSGDPIEGEWKHGKRVTFRNLAKFVFAMNRAPAISDKSYGFARKVIVINCGRRFSDDEKDVTLGDRLRLELPGILRWMVAGAVRLLKNGRFSESQAVRRDGARMMASMNPLLTFMAECAVLQQDLFWKKDDMYQAYLQFCEQSGYRKPLAKFNFFNEILSSFTSVREARRGMDEMGADGVLRAVRARVFRGVGPAALHGDMPLSMRDEFLLLEEEQG